MKKKNAIFGFVIYIILYYINYIITISDNMKADVRLRGNIEQIDGKNYLQFEKFDIKIYIEKSHIDLQNLFAQDPLLGRALNEVVNDNSDLFLSEIIPSLEASLSEKFTNIANRITRSFTYEELFPIK